MHSLDLQEVDSLEAVVIIDNELDPLSMPAPDTVQLSGNLGTIAMSAGHVLTDRGDACREMRMEDICCSAHGLSILVVRWRAFIFKKLRSSMFGDIDSHQRRQEAFRPLRCRPGRRHLGEKREATAAGPSLCRGDSIVALASGPLRSVRSQLTIHQMHQCARSD